MGQISDFLIFQQPLTTARMFDDKYPEAIMASITCVLTAEDRDQLRNPTLVSSMGLPLPC